MKYKLAFYFVFLLPRRLLCLSILLLMLALVVFMLGTVLRSGLTLVKRDLSSDLIQSGVFLLRANIVTTKWVTGAKVIHP